jgi:hypothetical protein
MSISSGCSPCRSIKAANIFECNVHADLLTGWPNPKFVGTGKVIDGLIEHLKGRRLGNFEFEEPTGILTHHLDQDEPAFDFIERLAEVTGGTPLVESLLPALLGLGASASARWCKPGWSAVAGQCPL